MRSTMLIFLFGIAPIIRDIYSVNFGNMCAMTYYPYVQTHKISLWHISANLYFTFQKISPDATLNSLG